MHTLQQLLKAYTMFNKDDEYVVMDGEVKIVDEQTGRIMEGRQWSDGLHQAIEAKEHVKVKEATQTFATITLQNYFRMYHKAGRHDRYGHHRGRRVLGHLQSSTWWKSRRTSPSYATTWTTACTRRRERNTTR